MWRKFFIGFEIMNAFNKIILSLYERGYHILLATVENIVTQRSLNAEVARLYFQLFFFCKYWRDLSLSSWRDFSLSSWRESIFCLWIDDKIFVYKLMERYYFWINVRELGIKFRKDYEHQCCFACDRIRWRHWVKISFTVIVNKVAIFVVTVVKVVFTDSTKSWHQLKNFDIKFRNSIWLQSAKNTSTNSCYSHHFTSSDRKKVHFLFEN